MWRFCDCTSVTLLLCVSLLREIRRVSMRCFTICIERVACCWAVTVVRAATAWKRRGGWRSIMAADPVAVVLSLRPLPSTSSASESDPSVSVPALDCLPRGPYTDMLGCSISRFSRGPVSTARCGELPPAVKQGGGVTNQLSSILGYTTWTGVDAPLAAASLSPSTERDKLTTTLGWPWLRGESPGLLSPEVLLESLQWYCVSNRSWSTDLSMTHKRLGLLERPKWEKKRDQD